MSDMDFGDSDTAPRCRGCRQIEDECECYHDADAPETCRHDRVVGDPCADCQTEHLAGMFRRLLDRIRQTEDETMGAALFARCQGDQ